MAHDTDRQNGMPKKKWVTPVVKQLEAGSAENRPTSVHADNPNKMS